jgi:hypothetical protein
MSRESRDQRSGTSDINRPSEALDPHQAGLAREGGLAATDGGKDAAVGRLNSLILAKTFPVRLNNFPVNLRRELPKKCACSTTASYHKIRSERRASSLVRL